MTILKLEKCVRNTFVIIVRFDNIFSLLPDYRKENISAVKKAHGAQLRVPLKPSDTLGL